MLIATNPIKQQFNQVMLPVSFFYKNTGAQWLLEPSAY